jgi:hypothetical protein
MTLKQLLNVESGPDIVLHRPVKRTIEVEQVDDIGHMTGSILTTKTDHNDMRSERTQTDNAMTQAQASDGIGQATRGLQASGHP